MHASGSSILSWKLIWAARPESRAASIARDLAWIVALSSVLFLTRLGAARLWDRDEPRNARCAVEMLSRHDWIVPTFNGELRAHKPILLYWAMMASYMCLGETEFAARLGSAAAAMGTVSLTYLMALRLHGRGAARWAATVLATSLMFHVSAHAATPDSLLIFFSTLGLTIFVFLFDEPFWRPNFYSSLQGFAPSARRANLCKTAALHGALAVAVLAKGPVGWILPTAIMICFGWLNAWCDNHATQPNYLERLAAPIRFLRPGVAMVMLLLVAAPWYLAVGWKTQGEWLRIFFWEHHVSRATQTMEGHSGHPLIYYPAVLLVGIFPWSILTVPGLIWLAAQKPWRSADRRLLFPLTWVGIYVVLFSAARTKLPSYITPCYPAMAILCGQFLHEWPSHVGAPARWWLRWSAGSLIVIGIGLLVGLVIAAQQFLPGSPWVASVALIPILGGLGLLRLFWREQWQSGFALLATCGAAMLLVAFGWIGPRVGRESKIDQLLATAQQLETNGALVSYGVHEPSWIFYGRRTIQFLPADHANEAARHLASPSTLLITSRHFLASLEKASASRLIQVAEVPNFLRDDPLLLVRAANPEQNLAQ